MRCLFVGVVSTYGRCLLIEVVTCGTTTSGGVHVMGVPYYERCLLVGGGHLLEVVT